jgi:hypothetical protein
MALSSYTHGYLAQLTKQLTDTANTLREVGKEVAGFDGKALDVNCKASVLERAVEVLVGFAAESKARAEAAKIDADARAKKEEVFKRAGLR